MDIRLINIDDLAQQLGYAGANSACRDWLASMRITPVPGRRGWYDPFLVRKRLDEAQGLSVQASRSDTPMSLTEQRKARLGKA